MTKFINLTPHAIEDENYDDSWHDIAGYATLVADRLASNSVTSITIERKRPFTSSNNEI